MDQNKFLSVGADGETEDFYGNFLLSLNGTLLFGMNILFAWLGIGFYHDPASGWKPLVVLIPMALFSFLFGGQLCYFSISEENLEIRNHVFRWYRRKYALKDIEILIFERSLGRMSNSLRVKSAGSRPWSYFAGSLRYEDWYAFEKALKKRGIAVDNKLWGF